jgi:hypothetical protein
MITGADPNPNTSIIPDTITGSSKNSSFFVGVIYNCHEAQLGDTLNSVMRQKTEEICVSVSVFHHQNQIPQIDIAGDFKFISFQSNQDFFEKLVHAIDCCSAEYCNIIRSGERLFDGAFDAVNSIFKKYAEINWLTGIQAYQAEHGFNIALGSTAMRRWSYGLYERNLYKNSGRFIAPASTFWRKSIWKPVSQDLYFVEQNNFCEDLWVALFKTQKLYTCKIYLSTAYNYDKLDRHGFKRPNYSALIEDSIWSRAKEFFFINNIPYLRLFYRKSTGFAPVIRFDLNTQSYFLSSY